MRNAPVGFAFIDQQLRFQVVNEKLAEINGLPADAHLGRDVREVVPDLAEVNEALFQRVFARRTDARGRGTRRDTSRSQPTARLARQLLPRARRHARR